MTDAFHHISEDAKSVASFLGGFRLAFAICLLWSVAFYLDVAVLGMRCVENAPVEWLQFALIATSGAAMAALVFALGAWVFSRLQKTFIYYI